MQTVTRRRGGRKRLRMSTDAALAVKRRWAVLASIHRWRKRQAAASSTPAMAIASGSRQLLGRDSLARSPRAWQLTTWSSAAEPFCSWEYHLGRPLLGRALCEFIRRLAPQATGPFARLNGEHQGEGNGKPSPEDRKGADRRRQPYDFAQFCLRRGPHRSVPRRLACPCQDVKHLENGSP